MQVQGEAPAEQEMRRFLDAVQRDRVERELHIFEKSWALWQSAKKTGRLDHMDFDGFSGPTHLHKMFKWIDGFAYGFAPTGPDFRALADLSVRHDQMVGTRLGLDLSTVDLHNIGYYNAQDYLFQRPYTMPGRFGIDSILDFGAGHGRMANLLVDDLTAGKIRYCAMDVTPACYLIQRLYFRTLGLTLNDYIDDPSWRLSDAPGVANHLPTWRFDLIPDGSISMIIAVQVLKELSRPMLAFALGHFARVLRPGGMVYVRDHIGFHNPSAVDLDAVLSAAGLVLEWQPRWIDRKDIHGIPRIWRKPEREALYGRD